MLCIRLESMLEILMDKEDLLIANPLITKKRKKSILYTNMTIITLKEWKSARRSMYDNTDYL